MDDITYLQLKTNMEIIQEIRSFRLEHSINEHVSCHLTGIINEKDKDNYVKEINEQRVIEIFIEGQNPDTLFKGFIEEIEVKFIGGMYEVAIKGISTSFLTDLDKKSRSFQNKHMTYEALVKTIMKSYQGGDIIDYASQGVAIENLILQYHETDWMFLKRLASHFNMGIIATANFATPKLLFGSYEGEHRGILEGYEYTIHKDIGYYQHSSKNTNMKFSELDAVTFEIETNRNYEIGDQITYQKISLFIMNKKIEMIKGLLRFRYQLCTKNGMGKERIFNEKITGTSLKGTVLEVIQDKIKVHLEIDEKQEIDKAWEFPYGTLYTAEGQSGWYCMPEIKDTVSIYFPTREEAGAIGTSALRIGSKGTDKIQNPAIKYFRTIHGKEIKFSPDEIMITCINGVDPDTGENKIVYIKMNQDNGIEIISSEPITFRSEKGIELEAKENIHIIAAEQIRLRCKQSEIRMDTVIDICSPHVKMN